MTALILQTMFLIAGVFGEFWLGTLFCMVSSSNVAEIVLGSSWVLLSLSPILGLIALKFQAIRPLYLAVAIATPIFWAGVFGFSYARVLTCDAP